MPAESNTDKMERMVLTILAFDLENREQFLERLRARMCLRCGAAVPQSQCYCDADD